MVPRDLQNEVWRTYKLGQEVSKRPSYDYMLAAARAIASITGDTRRVLMWEKAIKRRDEMRAAAVGNGAA